jgi:hypothetical protein
MSIFQRGDDTQIRRKMPQKIQYKKGIGQVKVSKNSLFIYVDVWDVFKPI